MTFDQLRLSNSYYQYVSLRGREKRGENEGGGREGRKGGMEDKDKGRVEESEREREREERKISRRSYELQPTLVVTDSKSSVLEWQTVTVALFQVRRSAIGVPCTSTNREHYGTHTVCLSSY